MAFMESKEIIETFIKKKLQPDTNVVNFFIKNPDKIQTIISHIDGLENKPTFISLGFIENILLDRGPKVEVLTTFSKPQLRYSTTELTTFLNEKYERYRKILSQRIELVNLISINRISDKIQKFSLIVMVMEKNDNELLVEDTTGKTTVYFENSTEDKNFVMEDEVIGLVCTNNGDRTVVTKIIWPDIPLRKEIARSKTETFCLFLSDMELNEGGNEKFTRIKQTIEKFRGKNTTLFLLGDSFESQEAADKLLGILPDSWMKFFIKGEKDTDLTVGIQTLNDPCLVKLDEVLILLSHGKFFEKHLKKLGTTADQIILNLLRKRNLNPETDYRNPSDTFFLNQLPDIVVVGHFKTPTQTNYKGTTIITNGGFSTTPTYWAVNLQTRENIKIDL